MPEHSIFGFIGKNGAGKTTTMKAILGLLKADSGEIYVMSEKVHFGQTNTNRHIGYLPDVPEFYSYMTPMEYLSLCGEVCGMDKTDIVTRSKELLELVGLGQEYHRTLRHMNGTALQVVVVNYESAWRLEKALTAWHPDLIIADEGHKIKTHNIAASKAMHRMGAKASYRLLLTGTVITNKAIDVFSQYKFLNPAIYGNSFYAFRNRYFDMVGYGNHTPVLKKSMEGELTEKLHSISYRATKAECLDLPETTDVIRQIELEPAALRIYRGLVKESYAELASGEVMKEEARKTMRVAVYCRLARADQDDTLLEVQKERLRVYAKERGYDIVAEIAEIGSGLSLNRPGIREMAGLAHRHMIDAVLVSDISRLCRDCGQALRLEGKLKKQGVSIESIKGNPLPEYRRARIALGCIMK